MDSSQSCINDVKSDNKIATKIYTRDDLFRLAKSMGFNSSFMEELKRYETVEWPDEYLKEVNTRAGELIEKYRPVRSMSNLGRQNSELSQDYYSLNENHRTVYDSRRKILSTTINNTDNFDDSSNKRRLSRMTSSPSIKYIGSSKVDPISSQVWAKYNKLIEASSSNVKMSPQNSTLQLENEKHNHVDRPTRLFGPLRREPKPILRDHDEPLSLPYMPITSTYKHLSQPNKDTDRRSSLNSNNQLIKQDEFASTSCSPIKRITSSSNWQSNDGQLAKAEDDDFDITSLLSITVLSDIKAIRHNEPTLAVNRKLGRESFNSNQTSQKGRTTTEMPMIRPITRARTSTDFTSRDSRQGYVAKQQRMYHESSKFDDFKGNTANTTSMSSINRYSFNQQNSFYDNREVAAYSSQRDLSSLNKNMKPIDESTAQIIETFKAQVKARAKAKVNTKAEESKHVLDNGLTVNSDGLSIKSSPAKDTQKTDERVVSATSDAGKVSNLSEGCNQVEEKENLPETNPSNDLRKVGNKDRDESQTQKRVDKIEESQAMKKSFEQFKSARENSSISNHVSNIPRLICLHKAHSSSKSAPDTLSKRSDDSIISLSNTTKAVQSDKSPERKTTTKTTATSAKFVSQYKLLRGKSLADEVEETSK